MKGTKAIVVVAVAFGLCSAAWAGDIEGRVTGMKGRSVVYVDAIAGKTFPAPKEHPVIDQKGLMFSPHIVVVQQGTTVDFLNGDNVAHNVFWTPLTKLVWCRCCATSTRKWWATLLSAPLRISPKRTTVAITRSKTFPTAATPWWFGMKVRRINPNP